MSTDAAIDTTATAPDPATSDPAEPSAEESPKITRHVAVCAFPFGAHAASLLQLVRRIAASAPPDVSVVFSFFNTASSNVKLFSSGVPDNIRPRTVVIPEGDGGDNEVDRFIEGAPDALKASVADAEGEVGVEIGCVVADAFIWFSRTIADEKSVPWVPFWTASPASLSALVSTDLFRTKFGTQGIQGKEKESADLIPGFSSVLAGDLPHGIIGGDLNSPGSKMLYNVGLNVPKATAVSINSFQELDPMITHDLISKLPSLLNVGPFPLISPTASSDSENDDDDDHHSCITWLDAHKDRPSSVVYVSFGTITTPSKDDIAALAEALESSGAPFLWSMRKEVRALLPEGFLERVTGNAGDCKIVLWAPQMKVLGHPAVGVFVTHCGWNSVIESVTTGVPMVCVPIMYDQALNSRFVEGVWKVGVRVERGDDNALTKEGVEKAIKRVLSTEEEGKAIRESAGAMKEKAEEAAKGPNGSSFKDSEKIVEIVMGLSPKDKKSKDKDSRSWKKWFKVFRVWKR